ncbi:MAG: ABC transporter substrate-binding protein [Limnochordia bacterium]|jgi:ABC-type glycerol-3-phosphate transport system substrate-binding protein
MKARRGIVAGIAVALMVIMAGLSSASQTRIHLVTYTMGGLTIDHWRSMVGKFMEANPDIHCEVQIFSGGEYNDKILTMIAADNAPDLMQTWAQYKPKFVQMGLLRDITSQWEQSSVVRRARLYPFVVEAAKSGGRLYGVPFDYNSHIWYINMDHLYESGVAPPNVNWTVEDFRELARKLTSPTKGVYGTLNSVALASTQNLQWSRLWIGEDWVSADRKTVMVDSPAYMEMTSFWNELQNTLNVTPGWPGAWSHLGDYYRGGLAMWMGWLSYAAAFADRVNHDWAFALMPKAPAGQLSFAQGHMFSIPVASRNAEAAWRLAEWMMSYEGQRSAVVDLKRPPSGPYNDLWNEFFAMLGPEKSSYARDWVMNVFYGPGLVYTMDYWETYPEANNIMAEHLRNVFSRQAPVGNELRNAAAKIRMLLEQ